MRPAIYTTLLTAIIILTGCDKRHELITIMPDGGAWHMFMQSEGIHTTSDALPDAAEGWDIFTEEQTDNDDEDDDSLIALKRIHAGQPYESSFAIPNTPEAATCLQFPTTLTIEQTTEGTYYNFHRVYPPRPYAFADYYQKLLKKNDEVARLLKKDPATLTPEERDKMTTLLIQYESQRTGVFLDKASESLPDSLPQLTWLRARQAALDFYNNQALNQQAVELMKNLKESGDELATLTSQWHEDALSACLDSLKQQNVPQTYRLALDNAYHTARQEYRITDDLGSTGFEFCLEMPGTILASNADSITTQIQSLADTTWYEFKETELTDPTPQSFIAALRQGKKDVTEALKTTAYSRADWSFNGDAFQDRPVELIATSFVPAEEK